MAEISLAHLARSGIYEIVNTVDGKRYIGSAVHFARRWKAHRQALRAGNHANCRLQRAWVKYGEPNFEFRMILICDAVNLLPYEQTCLDGLKPEYNLSTVAGSTRGIKYSEESRSRISAAMMGNRRGVGRKPSDYELSLIRGSKRSLGYKHSPETLAAMSLARLGNQYARGAKHSDEQRASRSEMMKKRWVALKAAGISNLSSRK